MSEAQEPQDGPVELNIGPEPAEGEAQPEQQEEQPSGGENTPEEEKPVDSAEDPLRDEQGRFKKGVEARIGELTRLRREAERSADYWKGIVTRNGAASGDNAAPTAKPTPDQFDDYGAYVEALTDWKVSDRATQSAKQNADTAAKQASEHREAEWGEKVKATSNAIPDYSDVVGKSELPIANHVADALMDADRGPELAYYLARNEDVATKLNAMSPARAAIELGRIEATLDAPATPPKARETTTSKAPAPITPVQPGSTTQKDPGKMSQGEYNEWRAAQLKAGR